MTEPAMNVIAPGAVGPIEPGYDHKWFAWSRTGGRKPAQWPGGRRVAVSVVLDLGAFEVMAHELVPPPGGRGVSPFPDYPRSSHREFGHRVGAFRCIDLFESLQIPFAACLDAMTVAHYAPVANRVAAAGDIIAAGLSANRPITSRMTEEEEQDYIAASLAALAPRLGETVGWQGPQRSESHRTPRLLTEAGVNFVLDWGNDDAPYLMDGAGAELVALPAVWELDDVNAMFLRGLDPWTYAQSLIDYVAGLVDEAPDHGVAVTIQLSGWLSGQAFRIAAIGKALEQIAADERVWMASPHDIVREVSGRA